MRIGLRRLAAALALGGAAAFTACTTPLEVGERHYRDGDRLAALESWRTIDEDSFYFEAAQRRIMEVEGEFQQLVVRHQQRARYFERKDRLAEAILNWRIAAKLDPGDAQALARAQELSRQLATRKANAQQRFDDAFASHDWTGTRASLEELRTLDPFDPNLARDESRFEGAIRGEVESKLASGRKAFSEGAYARAERELQAVLVLDPSNESAQGYLSYIASARGRGAPEAPVTAQRPGATSTPTRRPATTAAATDSEIRAEGFHQNALAAERRGDPYQAIRFEQRALEADPRNEAARRNLARLRTSLEPQVEDLIESGRISFRQEDLQGALDQWRRVLLIDPGNERAKSYSARAEKLLENLEQLRADDESASGVSP